ncbi:uncharacterized protein N7511_009972 [Penicillium nucicola]|uniref:uncharacterized protein n=1 Tax=Penicillium nucicola TaxID=1850975 RepID=UPI0025454AEA|nr:uncharacterized protein N7511_009972 [Penicillium nucicola]KAJ5748276.1 hypothetical protein N7511_009972 [Penicillium nucicola]
MQSANEAPTSRKRQNPNRCRPKSKGGCLRCKQRRRRCDETKPSCQECSKKGHTCPGYEKQNLKWRYVFKDDNPETAQSASPTETPKSLATDSFETTHLAQESEWKVFPHESEHQQDIAGSTALGQLPDIEDPTNIWFNLESGLPGMEMDNDDEQNSLSILRKQLSDTSIPSFLIQLPAMLVEYYFRTVCNQWSSFDCPLNPFRTIISRLWSRNAAIYFTIQSMSAASLANDFPSMRAIGRQTQQQAIVCLQNSMRGRSARMGDDEFFLALLMLGSTTGWHDPSDLGLSYLKAAQEHLLRQKHRSKSPNFGVAKQYPLFKQCLLYWNLLAAFVAEDSPILNEDSPTENSDSDLSIYLVDGQAIPHPWTGSLTYALSLFYRTARIIRTSKTSHRRQAQAVDPTVVDFSCLAEELDLRQRAEELEHSILFSGFSFYCGPVDIGDTNTPPSHFLTLAEAYRCAALLQIYHVFPEILEERLRTNHDSDSESSIPALFLLLFPITADWLLLSIEDTRHSLALHVVSLLDQLPSTSGTKVMQPVILACISSDLVFSSGSVLGPAANAIPNLNTLDVDIAQARRKVKMKLSELTIILPKLPMQRISNVIHETWDRADSGLEEFWLDVMLDLNLETIMG